ncbi:hypothetical protein, partial [Streptomyces sp. NPDC002172]
MERKYLLAGLLTSVLVGQGALAQGNDRVDFPANYRQGVHYATVERGGIREEIFTSRNAISAAKSGKPLPSGTVITMEDYREGKLFRYIVMEKRIGWAGDHGRGGHGLQRLLRRPVFRHPAARRERQRH